MNIDIDDFVEKQCSFTKSKAVSILTQTFDDLGNKGAIFDLQLFKQAMTYVTGFVILKIQKQRIKSMSESDARFYSSLGFPKERHHIRNEFSAASIDLFPETGNIVIMIMETLKLGMDTDQNFKQKIIDYFSKYHFIKIESEI